MTKAQVVKRYSEGFKRQVVQEYEDGASATALCRKYDVAISSVTTWVRKYAHEGLRHEVVHIQTPEEADQLRTLERERDLLQRAVADLTVQNLLLEGQLRVYQETYGKAALKKNEPSSSNTPTTPVREV